MADTHDPFAPAQGAAPAAAQIAADKHKPQKQWLVNLKTWLSFLQNQQDRETQVKFVAREKRDGGLWRITLPQQCCSCSATGDLQAKKFSRSLRCFESPVHIIGIGTLATGLLATGAFFMTSLMLPLLGAALVALLATIGLVYVKSWSEEVRTTLYACGKCAVDAREPAMAMDGDDLYMYVFTASLAEAATAAIKAERRGKSKLGDGGGARGTDDKLPMDAPEESSGPPKKKKKKAASADDQPAPPPKPATPHAPDLPPIPLDD